MLENIQKQVVRDLDNFPTHDDEDYQSEEYLTSSEEEESDYIPIPHQHPKKGLKRDKEKKEIQRKKSSKKNVKIEEPSDEGNNSIK